MNVSDEGLDFIKDWEGCSLKRYKDAAGYWTIGVGHLITDADPEIWSRPSSHSLKLQPITPEKALALLKNDVEFPNS